MQYEFKGQNLREVIKKSLGHKQFNQCNLLSVEYGNLSVELSLKAQRLSRIENRISRLHGKIEDEARNKPYDRARQIGTIILSLAAFHPALTAVRLAIAAARAVRTVSRAQAAAAEIGAAVFAVAPLTSVGLDLIEPTSKSELEDAKYEAASVLRDIQQLNRDILNVLKRMDSIGCDSIS